MQLNKIGKSIATSQYNRFFGTTDSLVPHELLNEVYGKSCHYLKLVLKSSEFCTSCEGETCNNKDGSLDAFKSKDY